MSPTFSTALTLLFVGMITVFVVLLLVVVVGKILIRIVNRYFPALEKTAATSTGEAEITGNTLAVLTAAVEVITDGEGHITQLKKRKNG